MSITTEFTLRVDRAPLPLATLTALEALLAHKGEPWGTDIHARYTGNGPDWAATAWANGAPVAHIWIGLDADCPSVGVLGHVFTLPEWRGKGLASRLLETSLRAAEAGGARWLELGTGNMAAIRLYERVGFEVLTEKPGEPELTMLRGPGGATPDPKTWRTSWYADAAAHVAAGRLTIAPFSRKHYAGAVLLLNAFLKEEGMTLLRIRDGRQAESRLIDHLVATSPEAETRVALAPDGRVVALLALQAGRREVVAAPGCEAVFA